MSPSNDQLKLAKNGNPFKSVEAAQQFIKAEELNPDIWGTMREGSGWAVAKHSYIVQNKDELLKQSEKRAESEAKAKKMTYHLVRVQPQGNENELDHVPMSLNGVELRIMRGDEGILPDNFIALLGDACHTNWVKSDDPEQPVKDGGKISRFPFSIIREATEAEYLEMLQSGNKMTKEAIERRQKQSV